MDVRLTWPALLAAIWFGAITPASAQQVRVQNGATLHMRNGGTLHLNGSEMDFGDTGATARLEERSGGRVTGGALTATRVLKSPTSADVAGLGAVITASVDLGSVSVRRGHVRNTLPDSSASVKRFYDITPSKNNRGLDASFTFHYAEAELDTLPEEALVLFKSVGRDSSWQLRGADSRDAVANTVTRDRIRSFSRWTLGVSKSSTAGPRIEVPGPRASNERPASYALEGNYPSPFNPSTTIRYQLPESGRVLLQVFDAMGRHVRTLVDGQKTAGVKTVTFHADELPSGIYFYRLQAGTFQRVRSMVLAK